MSSPSNAAHGLSRFVKDASWAFISLAVASGVHFILRIFLARYYGVGDLGLYTLAFSIYSFGLVFSCFGVDAGVVKYVAEYSGDPGRTKIVFTGGTIISVVTGLVLGIVFFLLSPIIANSFFKMPELTNMLRIVSCSFPFIAIEKVALGFLNGKRQMRAYALVNIVQNMLVAVLTITFAATGHAIIYAILGLILPIVMLSGISLLFVMKSFSWRTVINSNESSVLLKILLGFGFFVVLSAGVGIIQGYTATTLLGYFKSEVDVGLYSVVQTVLPVLTMPAGAIQTITNPMIAGYWGKNEISNIEVLVNKAMKSMALYSIAVSFILGLFSEDIVTLLFGTSFKTAALPLQISLVSGVFGAIQGSIGGALSSTNFVRLIFRITGIGVILNIILNLILDPIMGITGAAVATSASMSISSIINLYFIQRMVKIKIETMWFIKLFAFSLVLASAAYFAGQIWNRYFSLGIALVFFGFISLKYFVNREERNQIVSLFRSK